MTVLTQTKKKTNVLFITKISILSAIAAILMTIQIPLPIAPPFYQLDFSEVIVLIGGLALGPWAAVFIEGLKIVLMLLLNGSMTMGVGEIANFIIGCAFVLPPVMLYQKNKTRKTAFIGLMIGTVLMSIVGIIMNYYVLIPAYAFFMSPALTLDMIIAMGNAIYPSVNGLLSLVLLCVGPFNLVKGILVSSIVVITYKKVATLLK